MWEKRKGRFVRGAALLSGIAVVGIFVLLPSAAAAPQPTSPAMVTATGGTAPDLSTVPKIVSYLRSVGVDRTQIVIQRGARNYAGPNCPGMAWHCTRGAGFVIQAAQSGANTFECTPAGSGTNPATNTCVVFQNNTNGNNMATCRESSDVTPALLSCEVTQINVNGSNHANIDQKVDQRVGATQSAAVSAQLDQFNGSGSNHANLSQTISQSTSQVSGSMQSQDADFDADVNQDTDAGGNNFLQQSQTLNQSGTASGSSVAQLQTADHFGEVDQDALEGGGEEAFAVLSVGLQAASADGFSKATVSQTERQTLKGDGSQDQFGPMNCCGVGSQFGSPEQTLMTIHQTSTQKASQFAAGDAGQSQFVNGDCNTSGTCTIHHNVSNEADSLNQKVSGSGIQELFTTCFAGPGEGDPEGACFGGFPS